MECEGSEDGMDPAQNSGGGASVSEQQYSTMLPVPPNDTAAPTEGAQGPVELAQARKRTKLVSHTIDPLPPPMQVEIGRRAQVCHLPTFLNTF